MSAARAKIDRHLSWQLAFCCLVAFCHFAVANIAAAKRRLPSNGSHGSCYKNDDVTNCAGVRMRKLYQHVNLMGYVVACSTASRARLRRQSAFHIAARPTDRPSRDLAAVPDLPLEVATASCPNEKLSQWCQNQTLVRQKLTLQQ